MNSLLNVAGRLLVAQLFLLSGLSKITGYAGTKGYLAAKGLPGELLPLVILLEVGGGLALVIGFQTRWVALALAIFSVAAAFIFHFVPSDHGQMIHFMKNLGLMGAMLLVIANGTGPMSLDGRRGDVGGEVSAAVGVTR